MLNYIEIVKRIFEICETSSQTEVSKQTGVNQNVVSLWVSGERNPSLKGLAKVIAEKNVTWDWLLEGRGPKYRDGKEESHEL